MHDNFWCFWLMENVRLEKKIYSFKTDHLDTLTAKMPVVCYTGVSTIKPV